MKSWCKSERVKKTHYWRKIRCLKVKINKLQRILLYFWILNFVWKAPVTWHQDQDCVGAAYLPGCHNCPPFQKLLLKIHTVQPSQQKSKLFIEYEIDKLLVISEFQISFYHLWVRYMSGFKWYVSQCKTICKKIEICQALLKWFFLQFFLAKLLILALTHKDSK